MRPDGVSRRCHDTIRAQRLAAAVVNKLSTARLIAGTELRPLAMAPTLAAESVKMLIAGTPVVNRIATKARTESS